jgi:negative regulator of flagellin synthesis FlgM
MKIDKSAQQFATSAIPNERLNKTDASEKASVTSGGSSSERFMVSLSGVTTSDAPVDAARVAEIKDAIREGRFRVDSEKIADKLLASVQDLLNTRLQ